MTEIINRKPAVAGSFYTDNPNKLEKEIKSYLKKTKATKNGTVAVISPHAGYVFSGQTAAEAINQIDASKQYENIFILAVSHHVHIGGASVYSVGNYEMPGFTVEVNVDLAQKLIDEYSFFEFNKSAHYQEHSLEVQLPFLQFHLKNKFKIVPILIGTNNKFVIEQIADALRPFFNENNIFVISTDFSHFPNYDDALKVDSQTANSIISNKPEKFIDTLLENSSKNIKNLETSACGWANVLTLLYLTQNNKDFKYEIIDYKNSGDSIYGGKDRVVGYYAIAVRKKQMFKLSEKEKSVLLDIARKAINSYVMSSKIPEIDKSKLTPTLNLNVGAFVTLHNNGKLRGCIGQFMPTRPLFKVVQEMAIAAATNDNRFLPVNVDEIGDVDIEISVLTPLQKISSIDEIEIGRDGIYIKKAYNSGTLLPQVAVENGWTKEQFLEYCSKYKAGIGAEGWKEADLFIYQAILFEE